MSGAPGRLPLLIELPEYLDGSRVRLRPFLADDAPALWEAVDESREHLAPWLPWAASYRSVDDAREFVTRAAAWWLLRQHLPVGIFERESGHLLGGCGLQDINWDIRSFEIGYWLRRTAEGRGYMSEAVQLLTRWAFDALAANRVFIRMDARNQRSRAVAARLGFVHEGTLRNSLPDAEGAPRDFHMFALIPEDYRRLLWATGGE
ncbi:MAG: GNAT family N-acetyltransferase [Chloroflexota bacterium]|nr:GNAT family N-acetyltransferase [Chloroflexota bacterium]